MTTAAISTSLSCLAKGCICVGLPSLLGQVTIAFSFASLTKLPRSFASRTMLMVN